MTPTYHPSDWEDDDGPLTEEEWLWLIARLLLLAVLIIVPMVWWLESRF